MEKFKKVFAHKIFKISKWAFLILMCAFLILVVVRTFHYFDVQKTNNQVYKIHSTKLSLPDVMGDNLPPDPGVEADKTIQGIDANNNGIRDDVELAVFREYPNSAKTRAVLLQYALVSQMMANQPFVNTVLATSIAEKNSESYDCIGKIVPIGEGDIEKIETYRKFIEGKQLNTAERINLKKNFDNNVRSFELKSGCDVDLSNLPN